MILKQNVAFLFRDVQFINLHLREKEFLKIIFSFFKKKKINSLSPNLWTVLPIAEGGSEACEPLKINNRSFSFSFTLFQFSFGRFTQPEKNKEINVFSPF